MKRWMLVSRFRSSHIFAATSDANFGIKGTLALDDSSAPFEPEVRNRCCSNMSANFGFGALVAAAAIAIAAQSMAPAAAQDYPARPITLIVPQAPGGGNDAIARILADTMTRGLGQQIIVENRPGAGGTLGTRQFAKSAPDGYSLVMGSTGTIAMAPSVYPNVGYDPRKDFAPIGLIAKSAIVLVVGPSVPARSVQELIALGKKEPGKLTYGSGGVGSGNHLFGALFASMADIKMTHVPFRGANPAINDVMGGHVGMIFSSLPPTLGNIKSGALRALALGSLQRSPILPDLPTIDESGLRGFEAQQVYGLLAPAGTPARIVKRLNAALQDALTSDLVKTRIAADGAEPAPGSPEDYAQDIDREESKWSKVVEDAGAKAP
jgi:tripartite-type tricarboxylate transporter receptor subunit TctC